MPRPWIIAVVAAAAIGGVAGRAAAQDPYVRIREPAELRDGKPLPATPGRPVLISGVAWHPSGVRQVLVNGGVATLVPDAPLMNFEFRLVPDTMTRHVIVRVVPDSGDAFQTTFVLALTRAPATSAGSAASAPPATAPAAAPVARPAATPVNVTETSGPWDGFRERTILYMTGTALGLVLATRESATPAQRAIGGVAAGTSILIWILDASRTSREAHAADRSGGPGAHGPLDVNVGIGWRNTLAMQLRVWY